MVCPQDSISTVGRNPSELGHHLQWTTTGATLRDKGSIEILALLKGKGLCFQIWQNLLGDVKTCLKVPANQTKVGGPGSGTSKEWRVWRATLSIEWNLTLYNGTPQGQTMARSGKFPLFVRYKMVPREAKAIHSFPRLLLSSDMILARHGWLHHRSCSGRCLDSGSHTPSQPHKANIGVSWYLGLLNVVKQNEDE